MENLTFLQNVMSLGMLLLACIFLFLRSGGSRARMILAFTTLFWSLDYIGRLSGIIFRGAPVLIDDFFSPIALIFGTALIITMIPFVYEIARPGWLNWRRGFRLLMPWLSLSVFYILVLFILQEPIDKLQHFGDLRFYIQHFNVWFRFVLLLQIFYYLFVLHNITFRYKAYYDRWCRENYSSTDKMDISWLKYVAIGCSGITICFILILFGAGAWSYIFHQFMMQFVIAVCLYHALLHENPYSEKFFKDTLSEEKALVVNNQEEIKKTEADAGFTENLPVYKETVEQWMVKVQPYLRPDFKLLDVVEILPLNRSYLSRVFNEGFGASFSQVVQHYRMEKAKSLLLEDNNLTVQEIAYRSGFASLSSFHAIFVKKEGETPKSYRKNRGGH